MNKPARGPRRHSSSPKSHQRDQSRSGKKPSGYPGKNNRQERPLPPAASKTARQVQPAPQPQQRAADGTPVGADGKQRVAKLLAWRGLCSRREAERLIEHGNVLVNGVVIREPGARCAPDDDLQLTAYGDRWLAGQLTVLLHKPVGIVSTQAEENQQPAWQLLTAERAVPGCDPAIVQAVSDKPWQLHVAGRLDRASRGLLLLTQDGVLARTVTGTRTLTKHYQVKTDSPANPAQITELNRMRRLEGEPILPMHVTRGQRGALRFELQEGKKTPHPPSLRRG